MEVTPAPDIGVDVSGSNTTCSANCPTWSILFGLCAFEGEHITWGYGWNREYFLLHMLFVPTIQRLDLNTYVFIRDKEN